MRTRFALAAALAASLLLVASGPTAGADSSGMVPRGQVAWASLDHAVAVVAESASGTGQVAVVEGATGFPVAVSTTGAASGAGSVPAGACVALTVHGRQVAAGRADDQGRFALAGAVPVGAVATVRWAPCGGSEAEQTGCHNTTPHQHNPNKDEAASHVGDQGCAAAGDAGPDS